MTNTTKPPVFILFASGCEDEWFGSMADAKKDRAMRIREDWNEPSELVIVELPFHLQSVYDDAKDAAMMQNKSISDLVIIRKVLKNK